MGKKVSMVFHGIPRRKPNAVRRSIYLFKFKYRYFHLQKLVSNIFQRSQKNSSFIQISGRDEWITVDLKVWKCSKIWAVNWYEEMCKHLQFWIQICWSDVMRFTLFRIFANFTVAFFLIWEKEMWEDSLRIFIDT